MQRGSGPSTRVELCIVCHRTKTASPGLHLTSVGRGQRSASRGNKKKARAQGLKTVRRSVQLAKTGEGQYSNLS